MVFRDKPIGSGIQEASIVVGAVDLLLLSFLAGCFLDSEGCFAPDPPNVRSPGAPSLDLDTEGRPHLVYVDANREFLIYGSRDGGDWEVENVISVSPPFPGSRLSMVGDEPVILYSGTDSSGYFVKEQEWLFVTLDTEKQKDFRRFRATATSGPVAHFLFVDDQNDLYYTSGPRHGVWTEEQIDTEVLLPEDLEIDDLGAPHLVYIDIARQVRYATRTADRWSTETVGSISSSVDIGIAGIGEIYFLHMDETRTTMQLTIKKDSDWSTERIDEAASSFDLDLTAGGNPAVCYYSKDKKLKYAVRAETGWSTEVVDSEESVGRSCSLKVDNAGHPHVVYEDVANRVLKYANHTGSMWQVERIDDTDWSDLW